MKKLGIKLNRTHRWTLYIVFSALFFSGLLWEIFHFQAENGDSGLPHPSEPLWLKIHGAAAMLSLILLGSILPHHVKNAWQLKMNRGSGSLFLGLNLFLILTGYGLYYAGDEAFRLWLSHWHGWIGLSFPFLLTFHIWWGRRKSS
jgi:hypothetical protein